MVNKLNHHKTLTYIATFILITLISSSVYSINSKTTGQVVNTQAKPVGAKKNIKPTNPSSVSCQDRKSTRLNSSHVSQSRMPSSA